MYTPVFNKDSLLIVKEKFRLWKISKSDSLTRQLNNSLQNYTASIKNEKPFLYYVGSGFIYLKKLVKCGHANYHSVGINSSELPLYKKILRNSRSVLFYLFFSLGALVSLVYLRRKNPFLILLTLIAFCNIIYIAFFFRTPEFRYMLPSTLVFICFFSIAAGKTWDRIKNKIIFAKQ
jgi:hypothetical protein